MLRSTLVGMLVSLLLLAGFARAAAGQEGLVGTYDLSLSDDTGWHRHSLEITSSTSEAVEGVVALDWSLGPEARAPGPDDKVHRIPFRGDWDRSGGLHFQVTVGSTRPTDYAFVLYPIRRESTTCLVGTVAVERRQVTAEVTAGPWRHGVLATPRD